MRGDNGNCEPLCEPTVTVPGDWINIGSRHLDVKLVSQGRRNRKLVCYSNTLAAKGSLGAVNWK
jgi:hypothetical protein